jgi:hypothetical protein
VSAGIRATAIAILVAAGTLALYAIELDRAPIYLAHGTGAEGAAAF